LGGEVRCGRPPQAIRIVLGRLALGRERWRVEASLANETGVTVGIVRPHADEGTYFGLTAFRSAAGAEVARRVRERNLHALLLATHFEPGLPRLLEPGATWRGTFSGPGRLRRGRFVRVVLGRFTILGRPPPGLSRGFLCISEPGVPVR
jgi:hypothetical protein